MKNKMRIYNLHHFSLIYSFSIYSFSATIVMYMFKILKKIYKIFFSKT
jgi:hypothetical protein